MNLVFQFLTLLLSFLPNKISARELPRGPINAERDVADGEFAYIVSIQLMDTIEFPVCMGIILTPYEILTTAHCLGQHWESIRNNVHIYAGTRFLMPSDSVNMVNRKMQKFVIHPKYSREHPNYNVAILTIQQPLDFNGTNINRAIMNRNIYRVDDGEICEFLSWGIELYFDGSTKDLPLKATSVRIYSNESCEFIFWDTVYDINRICAMKPTLYPEHFAIDIGSVLICQNSIVAIAMHQNNIEDYRKPLNFMPLMKFEKFFIWAIESMRFEDRVKMVKSGWIGQRPANIAVCRSYLSAATRISERTGAISMVSLAQVLGFIVGPALQAAVTPLADQGIVLGSKFLTFNMYTAGGWINVAMGIGNIIMFLPAVFQEHKIAAREVMIMQGKGSEKDTWKSIKPDYVSAWTLIVAFFVLVFNFVLLETLGTSLTMDQFAWSKSEALYYMGLLMSVGAIVACATFVVITPLCKRFPEQNVLIWGGFSLMVVGRVLCIPWGDGPPKIAEVYNVTVHGMSSSNDTVSPNDSRFLGCPETQKWCFDIPALTITQFLLGYGFTSIGYPIGVTLIQTIFSKILGPRPQGVWMGLMTGSGSMSRVMGPVFVSYIYTRLGTYWTFGFTSVMMFVSMLWLWFFRTNLQPPTFEKPAVEMQELNPKVAEGDVEHNASNRQKS